MICITQRVRSDSAPLCPEMGYHIYSLLLNRMKDAAYTGRLHSGREKTPVSVTVLPDAGKTQEGTVRICLFHEEAVRHFYPVIPDDCYRLRRTRCTLTVLQRQERTLGEEELLTQWFLPETRIPAYLDLCFLTPTAFHKHRRLLPVPEVHALLRAAASQFNLLDLSSAVEELYLLQKMEQAIVVHSCDIRTRPFPFKPDLSCCGFTGRMRIQLRGADAVNRLLYMLLYAAQYTGIGARTALGMGRIQLVPCGRKTGSRAGRRGNSRADGLRSSENCDIISTN